MKLRLNNIIFFAIILLFFIPGESNHTKYLYATKGGSIINTKQQGLPGYTTSPQNGHRNEVKNKMRTKALDGSYALKVNSAWTPAFIIFYAKQTNFPYSVTTLINHYFYQNHLRSPPGHCNLL